MATSHSLQKVSRRCFAKSSRESTSLTRNTGEKSARMPRWGRVHIAECQNGGTVYTAECKDEGMVHIVECLGKSGVYTAECEDEGMVHIAKCQVRVEFTLCKMPRWGWSSHCRMQRWGPSSLWLLRKYEDKGFRGETRILKRWMFCRQGSLSSGAPTLLEWQLEVRELVETNTPRIDTSLYTQNW